MAAVYDQHKDIRPSLQFDEVKENFVAAARLGLGAHLWWIGRKDVPARDLLLDELIPLARHGLELGNLDSADIDRYLGVVSERVESGRSGSQWLLDSYTATRDQGTRAERLASLVAATVSRQREGTPVHGWPLAAIDETGGWQGHYLQVGQFMTTDLFTVNADELVDLAASMMDWRKIRHVPVEDAQHKLVGLVTHRTILRLVARDPDVFHGKSVPVSEIMERNLITGSPGMTTLEAINLMRLHTVGCLPIVEGDRLVGIVTERDFMNVAGQLLEAMMHGPPAGGRARPGEFAREGTDD
jgi:CBS domain-containing protein